MDTPLLDAQRQVDQAVLCLTELVHPDTDFFESLEELKDSAKDYLAKASSILEDAGYDTVDAHTNDEYGNPCCERVVIDPVLAAASATFYNVSVQIEQINSLGNVSTVIEVLNTYIPSRLPERLRLEIELAAHAPDFDSAY